MLPLTNGRFEDLVEFEQQAVPCPRPGKEPHVGPYDLRGGAGLDSGGQGALLFAEQARPGLESGAASTR